MLKWLRGRLTCGLTIVLAMANAAPAEVAPFWKSKAKVYERVQNREVIVAVSADDVPGAAEHVLRVAGGGQVRASREFLYATAQDYANLPHVTDYIESAKFDPQKHVLEIAIAAYGQRAQMQIEVHEIKTVEPWRLDYRVLTGPLTGFAGAFSFASLKPPLAEVGMSGEYRYAHFPLPQFFVRFGLEVIFQKIALRLRGHVEEQWKKKNPG